MLLKNFALKIIICNFAILIFKKTSTQTKNIHITDKMNTHRHSGLMLRTLLLIITVLLTNASWAQFLSAPAFPGAEGFGRYTTGGRGGQVIHVTNLNDSGTGSLRAAVEASGKRIVVFDVAGTIELQSDLKIINDNISILGQTAPGDGICLRNYTLKIHANNVIVRYIRCRMGDTAQNENDAISADNQTGSEKQNIIIDHCSVSWCVDECGSFYGNENFTLQWCILSESLTNSVHGKGSHGYGGIWGGSKAAFHHNLLAHHNSRNPRFDHGYVSELAGVVDYINNVVYNWGGNSTYGGENKPGLEPKKFNMVNNYYKPGPRTINVSKCTNRLLNPTTKCSNCNSSDQYDVVPGKFYINGNKVNGTTVSLTTSSTSCSNIAFDSGYDFSSFASNCLMNARELSSDNDFSQYNTISTHSADNAFTKTVQYAGASLSRDAVDTRIANETTNGTYTYTGSNGSTYGLIDSQSDVNGWPTLSGTALTDTDKDGIPDSWETAHGLSNSVDNSATYNLDKYGIYTDLEVYANYLVQDITKAERADATASFDEYYPLDANAIAPISDTKASAPYINANITGKVTITSIESNATIYYTTDGSTPTTSSKRYTNAFVVGEACTVKAIATVSGKQNSDVTSYAVRNHGIAYAYMVDTSDPAPNAEISSVDGITLKYGACTDWTCGNAAITVKGVTFPSYASATSSNGTNSTSLATNLPTDKSYWIFTPTEDGMLTLAVHNIGKGKSICICEDGTLIGAKLVDVDGTTTSSLTTTTLTAGGTLPSESGWSGGIQFEVKAGSTYTYSLSGSKGHFCGFIFESDSAQPADQTLFSMTSTATQNVNVEAGADLNLSSYATITGGTALIHNGHQDTAANMISSSGVRVGNSGGSYIKITLDNALKAGDILTTTGDDGGYVATTYTDSNTDNISGNAFTFTSAFEGVKTLYITRGATKPWISSIIITHGDAPTTLTLTDGEEYSLSADKIYEEVTFTKSFSESLSNKWTALYVPFAIDIEDYAEVFDIAEINAFAPYRDTNGDGMVNDADDDMLIVTKIKSGTTTPNMPYLIRAKAAGDVTIVPVDNKLYAATSGLKVCQTNKGTYTFTGLNSSVTANASNNYYYMSSGTISHRTSGETVIKPNRWYMTVSSGSTSAKPSFSIVVLDEESEATAIMRTNCDNASRSEAIYNINGTPVNKNIKQLPAGIYIQNNKKHIRK